MTHDNTRRLRDWADAGVEMFVHGWFHKDLSDHSGAAAFILQGAIDALTSG